MNMKLLFAIVIVYIITSITFLIIENKHINYKTNKLWYYNLGSIFIFFNIQNFRKMDNDNYIQLSIVMIIIFSLLIPFMILTLLQNSYELSILIHLTYINIVIQCIFLIMYLGLPLYYKNIHTCSNKNEVIFTNFEDILQPI